MSRILTISNPKLSFLQSNLRITFPVDGPWYWWVPTQTPKNAFVNGAWVEGDYTFGDRDEAGHFIVNGHAPFDQFPPGSFLANTESIVSHESKFELLPYESGTVEFHDGVIKPPPTPVPTTPFGFGSLIDAIDNGTPDSSEHLGFTVPNTQHTDFADYGLLPLRAPPTDPSTFDSEIPNIWQLTGISQPPLQNPVLPWNDPFYMFYNILGGDELAGPNPYLKPTKEQAALVVSTFVDMWNTSSSEANAAFPAFFPPPPCAFVIPFGNGIQSFGGGITVGWGVFPLIVLQPATSTLIAASQLPPDQWDTDVFPPARLGP